MYKTNIRFRLKKHNNFVAFIDGKKVIMGRFEQEMKKELKNKKTKGESQVVKALE